MVQQPEKSAEPVSMSKQPTGGVPATPARPRVVTAAVVAMVLSGVAALAAAIALFGQDSWLTTEMVKAHKSSVSDAVTSAAAAASSSSADVAQAKASASSSAVKAFPTTAAGVHDQVGGQQTTILVMAIIFVAALAFIASGVYRGRHWSRWATILFWVLASLATPFGIQGALSISADVPSSYKVSLFCAGLMFTLAVILVNLRDSTAYFALSRPAGAPGRAANRGLFAPRTPPARRPGTEPAAKAKSALTSSAAERGEAYIQKQRAKKRATANAEAVAKGAELARNRAKASKSRRTEK